MVHSRLELRVGIFVFVGLTLFCVMIIMFGFRNVKLLQDVYRLTAVFKFTNGLVVGAPVRYSGVDVGKVTAIEFAPDTTTDVYLHIDVQKGVTIRKDARLIINSLGILGEKYLEFMPKSTIADPYLEGDKVLGEEPVALNDVISEGLNLVEDIRSVFQDIFDSQTKENIKKVIQNVNALTDEETQKTFKASLENIANLTGSQTQKELSEALNGFQEASHSFALVIQDHREDFDIIFNRLKVASQSMASVGISLKKSKGTLGLLISNPAVHEKLESVLTNFNEWITMVRKHGLLYKERDVAKEQTSTYSPKNNRGYLRRR